MTEQKNIVDRLSDEFVNDISVSDLQSLDEWVKDGENRSAFRRLVNEMQLPLEIRVEGEKMRTGILRHINNIIDRKQKRKLWLKTVSVAASVLLMLVVTNYFAFQHGYRQQNSQQVEMFTPLGIRSTIVLPDGSKVILNAGTKITYPTAFISKNREVEITGEAFFEVAQDTNHPFIVKAENIAVEALGTQFNVKAYKEENKIDVSLVEGKVRIGIENRAGQLNILPGEQVSYDKNEHNLKKYNANMAHYTSWKEGKYYFNALPLEDIACQLERIFNVKIHISSGNLKQMLLTGDFVRGENLEQILRVMTADKRMYYKIEGDIVSIKEK